MPLKKKKILITGAGGFIGSHLVEELVALGNEVTALVHYNSFNSWGNLELIERDVLKNTSVVSGNIEDPFCVQKAVKGKEVVFHLAALIGIPYSYDAPLNYVRTNVEGTVNVMDACLKCGVEKVVHTSTSEVYGTALYTPIDEKHPLQGQSPYSASKIGADKIAESYHLSFGLPVATMRPFNAFGPRQSARALISTIISQALKGDIVKLGSLDTVRDMNYVQNTVYGFIKTAEQPASAGEVINIGSGKAYAIREIAETIFRIIGKHVRIVQETERIRPEKSEVMRLLCDNGKAKKLLGWEEIVGFEDGLKKTVEWIEKNLSLFKTDIYNV